MDLALKEPAKCDSRSEIEIALPRFDNNTTTTASNSRTRSSPPSSSPSSPTVSHAVNPLKKSSIPNKPAYHEIPSNTEGSSGNINSVETKEEESSLELNNVDSKKSTLKKIADFFKYHHGHNHYQDIYKNLSSNNTNSNDHSRSKDDHAIEKHKTSTSLSIKRQKTRIRSVSFNCDEHYPNDSNQNEHVKSVLEKTRSKSECRPQLTHSASVNDDRFQRERRTSFYSDVLVIEFDKKCKLELTTPYCHVEKLKDYEQNNDEEVDLPKKLELIEEQRTENGIDNNKKDEEEEEDNDEKENKCYNKNLNITIDKGIFHTKKAQYNHSLSWPSTHDHNKFENTEYDTEGNAEAEIKITRFTGTCDIEIIHGNQIVQKNGIVLKSVLKKSKSVPNQAKINVQDLIDEALYMNG